MTDLTKLTVDELLAFAIDTENNWLPRRLHVQELARKAQANDAMRKDVLREAIAY